MPYCIYGHSIQGTSHRDRGVVCQDAHKYIELKNGGWVIAAVADGVGSASRAEVGSRLAVETAVDFIADNMPLSLRENGIKRVIYVAFNAALRRIMKQADYDQCPLHQYDTTLSLVVYNGTELFYGHVGDGGIFGLSAYGDYVEITTPQKEEDGISVIPLRAGEDCWKIDAYRDPISSVLLATDGIRDAMKPYLLANHSPSVYVPICSLLMHPATLTAQSSADMQRFIGAYLEDKLPIKDIFSRLLPVYQACLETAQEVSHTLTPSAKTGYVTKLVQQVTDDRTVLAVINVDADSFPEKKHGAYYSEPDWNQLKEAYNRSLYSMPEEQTLQPPEEPMVQPPKEQSVPPAKVIVREAPQEKIAAEAPVHTKPRRPAKRLLWIALFLLLALAAIILFGNAWRKHIREPQEPSTTTAAAVRQAAKSSTAVHTASSRASRRTAGNTAAPAANATEEVLDILETAPQPQQSELEPQTEAEEEETSEASIAHEDESTQLE